MSEAKFTKGEWILNPKGFLGELELTTQSRIDELNIPILKIDTNYIGIIGREQKANANLIAAAPEMYEMLAKISSEMECFHGVDTESIENLLAKARGE